MARNNFQYEKRQRELEKKRKAEEKAKRKLETRRGADEPETGAAEAAAEPGLGTDAPQELS